MLEITANYAAKNLAELLEAIEERGESFTVIRRGRVVAELGPTATGAAVPVLGSGAVRLAVAPAEPAVARVIDLRDHMSQAAAAAVDEALAADEAVGEFEEEPKHRRRFFRRHPFWLRNRAHAAA